MAKQEDSQDELQSVTNTPQIAAYLEKLAQRGTASVCLKNGSNEEYPALFHEITPEEEIILDFTGIRDFVPPLRGGANFLIYGYTPTGFVRTAPVKVERFENLDGRLLGKVTWPNRVEVRQRRASFRATLRVGMEALVTLKSSSLDSGETISLVGDLRDLSADGCLAEFSIYSSASKLLPDFVAMCELTFPNGTQLELMADIRHIQTDYDRKVIAAGVRFQNVEQERQIWNLVQEIEREASRNAHEGSHRSPTDLFTYKDGGQALLGRRQSRNHPTPMANLLANLAGYLDSQMLLLQQEGRFDSYQLSKQTDHLLQLLKEDREAVLFATQCLHHESLWVQHCIAVASRLGDLLLALKTPQDVLKSATAAALIHDLGKVLINPTLWRSTSLSHLGYQQIQEHAKKTYHAALGIKWIPPAISENVVLQVNERLDGKGYPNRLSGDAIGQLARAAMVIDVMDALQRPRPDRNPLNSATAWQLINGVHGVFDDRWKARYLERFGKIAVGSLIRFDSGQLAWVTGLDADNKIREVRLTPHANPPDHELGETLQDSKLRVLGGIREIVAVQN
ncbi:3'3'-cGAMP-specific phosphodiesterase 2 [Pseudidiomarina piscicola]|uniref:3'3'-cGAMP-specific phosphodiesterase 2 n=1 Tax=Pseudidiomarina piscicola TaxID=2614830 RepID=A0A6S6WJZ5_9GAMM|nr:HD domain-containing phosphohydrolase [Pseudidiomarina piscicola]CAB0151059.1 3'3'-cGAMP-specific phosphodiesterase 2 [Pseudidiomarina piscicola]VZT40569.1 3'3'-cGAMP-specific phosphodiesterase 2 [Pseudomonas aeruginosa]